MNLSEVIASLKKEKGVKNEQISEATGIPKSTIDKITAGSTIDPKLSTLNALANYFGCTIDDFAERQKREAPVSFETEADIAKQAEKYYNLLIAGGYIREGESLTKEQTEAFKAILTLMDITFKGGDK